ncbi:MAG TPA: potassium-transporting ATPase subunit KdpC [Polyangiales bacterium]|nr:potassium-transporting ATPase subunit KdpC [Polyangiales bacterium]
MSSVRPALVLLALFTVLTGGLYPAAVTVAAQALFPQQAAGSLHAHGSTLIGQAFSDPAYFWGRPSAASYDASASSGSNLGPRNPALVEAVQQRVHALRDADPGNTAPVPIDLVTTSGSGLDPHISPEAARYQSARVARLRQLSNARVVALIDEHTRGRTFGLLGEPRVDVLGLNLALDGVAP